MDLVERYLGRVRGEEGRESEGGGRDGEGAMEGGREEGRESGEGGR